jgi:aryl-alcohol dehydrogenase-like predicted oxidoreductase
MKIALGTVQFGVLYGISNNLGQTKKSEVEKILKYSYKNGIDMLDTAPSYGDSEGIVGDIIHNYSDNKHWRVITKTPHFKGDTIGDKQTNELLENFKISSNKLGEKNIYGLLVHDCNDLFLPGGEKLFNEMNNLKKNGLIKKIGVSLYSSKQIDTLLNNYDIDLVQLPVNILDQRLVNGRQLSRLKEHGVEIHVRSIFLQGLLLMPLNSIPSWFEPIMDKLCLLHQEARKQNMSVLQLAIAFVQSISDIDRVIIGVNTLDQMKEVINAASIKIDITDFSNLAVNDITYLNPSNWKV